MGNAEPGWYDDGTGYLRWWDGTQWTPDYADMTGSSVTLHVGVTTPIPIVRAPGWYDDQRGRLRWWDGSSWTQECRFSGAETGFAGIVVDGPWIHYQHASQPVAGVRAVVETAGEIAQRSTVTRAAAGWVLLGPVGAVAGAMFKKNVDRRELYIAIEGSESFWVAPVDPRMSLHARQFAAWVNSMSRHFAQHSR